LLKNEGGLLPFQGGRTRSIAVVGRYAGGDPPSEGGSASVQPVHFTSELQGLQQVANGTTRVDYLREGNLDFKIAEFRALGANGQYQPGLKAEYFTNQNLSGTPILTRQEAYLAVHFPTDEPSEVGSSPFSVRWSGEIVPPVTGDYAVKLQVMSNARAYLGNQSIFDNWDEVDPLDFDFFHWAPSIVVRKVHLQAGQPLSVRVEFKWPGTAIYGDPNGVPITSAGLGWATLEPPVNLGTYDAVVITAGFDNTYETEGVDRPYELPEYQDDLILNMAAANPHTVVVLHGGGDMDIQKWIGQVSGLVHALYPGQDGGQALAEILFGKVNPSGKLPFTFEKRFQDNPAYANYPLDLSRDPTANTTVYHEGIFMGYRGFDKNNIEPQYPFGYGLSYTTFHYSDLSIVPAAPLPEVEARVSFTVTNTGQRAGAEVAQLYVGKSDSKIDWPIRELKGFQKVYLSPGESRRVTLKINSRALAYWDATTHKWAMEAGTYQLWVGGSSRDLPLQGSWIATQDGPL
jgi:beta-glucosidase